MINQERFDRELKDAETLQTEQRRQFRIQHKQNKAQFKVVKAALGPAKRSLDLRDWPGSTEETVVCLVPPWRRSQRTRLILLVGEPFDGSLASVPKDESDQPIWLGEDGRLYQLDTMMLKYYPKPGSPAFTPVDLRYVSYRSNWPEVLSALRQLISG